MFGEVIIGAAWGAIMQAVQVMTSSGHEEMSQVRSLELPKVCLLRCSGQLGNSGRCIHRFVSVFLLLRRYLFRFQLRLLQYLVIQDL